MFADVIYGIVCSIVCVCEVNTGCLLFFVRSLFKFLLPNIQHCNHLTLLKKVDYYFTTIEKQKNFFCAFCAFISIALLAQDIWLENASFEDEPQDATMPQGWRGWKKGTTPDILPGSWGVI